MISKLKGIVLSTVFCIVAAVLVNVYAPAFIMQGFNLNTVIVVSAVAGFIIGCVSSFCKTHPVILGALCTLIPGVLFCAVIFTHGGIANVTAVLVPTLWAALIGAVSGLGYRLSAS